MPNALENPSESHGCCGLEITSSDKMSRVLPAPTSWKGLKLYFEGRKCEEHAGFPENGEKF